MSGLNELRDGFFQECEELLEALSDGFSEIEGGNEDGEVINAVFRAVHSIKGGAGAFGLEALVDFAHAFENVLDDVRSGNLSIDARMLGLFFHSGDQLAYLVECARDEIDIEPERGADLLEKLRKLSGCEDTEVEEEEVSSDDFSAITLDFSMPVGGAQEPSEISYDITFRASRDLYAHGNDPALLFRTLSELGTLEVEADLEQVAPLGAGQWDTPAISWTLSLKTDKSEDDVREVFEFVEGLCELDIKSDAPEQSADLPELVAPAPEEIPPLPDNIVNIEEPKPAAEAPKKAEKTPEKPRAAASGKAAPAKAKSAAAKTTIRVDLDRVDRLINIVGELVISESMLSQSIQEANLAGDTHVETAMTQLKQLSTELQESVMAIRAQPVKTLFQRMSRIVREAAQATEKSARLVTEGETTEVDKTVIERLADPLTHMIRNAVDHGLETADKRAENEKPAQGTVTLSAAHRSGRVIIELSDDGAGINRPRVRQIAEERGLISPEQELTNSEIDNLLFLPGFSTTQEVSNLSGRGVGMDVVKSEIQALGGRVSISSTEGKGTTVSISLPLTLAVLEGMIVEVANETVVVPTTALRETIRASDAAVNCLGAQDRILTMRDELVPIVDLGERLGFRSSPVAFDGCTLLLIETDDGKRTAVAVDRVFEQREVVIKGLEQNYGNIPGIAAATILGDGRIALIIDTDQLTPTGIPGMETLSA